jgi:uncharacterized protein
MKTRNTTGWSDKLRDQLPTREELAANRWLGRLTLRITDRKLWRVQHEAVARGVAIGLFWAFLLPVAQIMVAAVHCIWWRAHIPSAAAATLVTNPFTIGFWLWAAYSVGGTLLGQSGSAPAIGDVGLGSWLMTVGQPAIFGMGIFALAGAALGYGLVWLIWRANIALKKRKRRVRPGL